MIEQLQFNRKPICTKSVKAFTEEYGYLIKVGKEGGTLRLEGEKGKVGGVTWSEDKYFVIPIQYDAYHSYYFNYTIYAHDGSFVQADFSTLPFMDVEVSFPLTFLNLETVFMPRTPGRLKNMMHGTPIKAEDVVAIELRIPPSATECEIRCRYPYLTDQLDNQDINRKPEVDSFGQWRRKEWVGKTKSEEELKEILLKELEKEPSTVASRSCYGGELSLKREGTGFFRIHKEGKRYWLCDPEGYLMFSCGVDLITPYEFSPTKHLTSLFETLPLNEGEYSKAWNGSSVSLLTANLIRVFGADWFDKWTRLTKNRIEEWGFNSIANWADKSFVERAKKSYVQQGPFPTTKTTIFRSMPDVFSKEYRDNAWECAQWLQPYKDDKYMIGYFMRNEPDWAFGEYNLAEIMMEKDDPFVTKEIFISDLVRKYKTIDKLNQSWNLSLESFDELRKPIHRLSKQSREAELDTKDFTRRIIREYVRVPAEAYRQVDRNHLNLGLRYGWLATDDLTIGCEYCDVFSINCYQEAPDKEYFDRIHAMTNLPILIGEFQTGALDVGMMSNSMYGVTSQEERAVFYRYYMETAASLPYMLGAHYFQWNDQPTLGRFDGENVNIGLVDVCSRPYTGYVSEFRKTHERLSKVHSGECEPTTKRSHIVPREGF